jgi:splicing factor 3B subunit 4
MDIPSATFLAGNYAQVASLYDRNPDATLCVSNLDVQVDEDLLAELFIQCAPVVAVTVVKDRLTAANAGLAFVELKSVRDAEYCMRVLNMVKLYFKPLRVQKAKSAEGGSGSAGRLINANVYVGNLGQSVTESDLEEVFGTFGKILFVKIPKDAESQLSQGFGFVTFENFQVSDAAIKAMDGQFLGGEPVKVAYATNKEGGGSAVERLLADLASRSVPHV